MPEGIIDMGDMEVIFSVTDALGIDRETIRVELGKEDPGSIGRTADGTIEITVPESEPVRQFATRLRSELEGMGYEPSEAGNSSEEDEDNWL